MFEWLRDFFFCQGDSPVNDKDAIVKKSRKEADEWATKRTAYVEESKVAYRNGEYKKAKKLSKEAIKCCKKMEKANWNAAKAILKPQRSKEIGILDLHGLYLEEAKAATDQLLDHWTSYPEKSRPESVQIIAEAGKHSRREGYPVIRPEVEIFLKERDLEYAMMKGDGAFLVYINPSARRERNTILSIGQIIPHFQQYHCCRFIKVVIHGVFEECYVLVLALICLLCFISTINYFQLNSFIINIYSSK